MIRLGSLGELSDCAGGSGCGKVYYKVYLRYSGPETNTFNLPYQELTVNVELESEQKVSYIDEKSTKQCFKNGGKWPTDVFQVSGQQAGIHLMVGEGQSQESTCLDPKKRVTFQPGTPPSGSAPCPNPDNDCMYLELFTLAVNAVPGDTINLNLLPQSLLKSTTVTCSTLQYENSINLSNANANAIIPYPVPALAAPTGVNANVALEITGNPAGPAPRLDFQISLRNNSSNPVTIARVEFSIEVLASSALALPTMRLSYGNIQPVHILPAPNNPNLYTLRYVITGITVPGSGGLAPLGSLSIAAVQPYNQKWWGKVTILANKTLLEATDGCSKANVSGSGAILLDYHNGGGDNFCDLNVTPSTTFFVKEGTEECENTYDIEVGIRAPEGASPIISTLRFEVQFEMPNGTQLLPNVDVSEWFNCNDCTAPVLTGNVLSCDFTTTAGVSLQGERKVIISYGNATGCIKVHVRVLYIHYRGYSSGCIPQLSYSEICPPNVRGLITTEALAGVSQVTVEVLPSLNSCSSKTTMTLDNGYYGVCVQDCAAPLFTITPSREDNPLNGVTTLDLALISKHILNLQPLNSPYKIIAADANKSGTVTTLDIVALRRLILGIDEELQNVNSWRFVDRDYSFPVVTNPFYEPFPETKAVPKNGVANFIGIKVGDVNGTAKAKYGKAVQINWAGLEASGDRIITVPVYYSGQTDVQCLQFGLRFDPAQLTLTGTLSGDLPGWDENCFGLTKATRGEIRTLWLPMGENDENPIKPGTLLFSLVFRTRQSIAEKGLSLRLDNRVLQSASWTFEQTEHPVLKGNDVAQRQDTKGLSLDAPVFKAGCYPNPASGSVQFTIENDKEEEGRIALFNTLGQRVFVRNVSLLEGQQTLSVAEAATLPRGVYIWKVYSKTQKAQGNVILE
jgi:hypothetical protein